MAIRAPIKADGLPIPRSCFSFNEAVVKTLDLKGSAKIDSR